MYSNPNCGNWEQMLLETSCLGVGDALQASRLQGSFKFWYTRLGSESQM